MVEYPMTFDEFEKRFATEQDCRKYLYELRFPKGYNCPKCGNEKRWEIGETLYECSKCGHQASIISGTIFQDTRKPCGLLVRTHLVYSDMVGNHAKIRRKRKRIAADSWIEKLPDSMDVAP
jgi:ribosomal protein L37AE/L43A